MRASSIVTLLVIGVVLSPRGLHAQTAGAELRANAVSAIAHAQTTMTRPDWESARRAAQALDSIVPSDESKFYVGISSFQVGVSIIRDVVSLAKTAPSRDDDRVAACAQSKAASVVFAAAATAIPASGDIDRAASGQILSAISQYDRYIDQVKKDYCLR